MSENTIYNVDDVVVTTAQGMPNPTITGTYKVLTQFTPVDKFEALREELSLQVNVPEAPSTPEAAEVFIDRLIEDGLMEQTDFPTLHMEGLPATPIRHLLQTDSVPA